MELVIPSNINFNFQKKERPQNIPIFMHEKKLDESISFVKAKVSTFNEEYFDSFKTFILDNDYLNFSLIDRDSITRQTFEEKLCDYFEKVELNEKKSFAQLIEKYKLDMDAIVKERIAPQKKGKDKIVSVPRARKYYNKALQISKENTESKRGLADYSRIMFCLYTALIGNKFGVTSDFIFSIQCLDLDKILKAMKEAPYKNRKRFNLSEPYGADSCTFIITIIMFYNIKSKEIPEEI